MIRKHQAGFSAIELLITLFVGAAFIATGYQLYSVILQNSSDARTRSKASNIAYDTLRKYSSQATSPCTNATPTPTPTVPTGSALGGAPAITVTISCPYGALSTTSKIQVNLTFGSPQQEVVHAIYVTE